MTAGSFKSTQRVKRRKDPRHCRSDALIYLMRQASAAATLLLNEDSRYCRYFRSRRDARHP
jgi:hypothetical protein